MKNNEISSLKKLQKAKEIDLVNRDNFKNSQRMPFKFGELFD